MKIFFIFIILLTQDFINASAPYQYCTISVNGKMIPSLIEWIAIENFEKPFEYKVRLVTNKKLYKTYILPFEQYLELTEKPILIWETQSYNINGNGLAYFNPDQNIPHNVLVPAPASKYIATILHELVHIYIKKREMALNFNLKESIRWHQLYNCGLAIASFAVLPYTSNHLNTFIAIVHGFAQIVRALTGKNRYSQLTEMICDSYAGIIFENEVTNLKVIENDIHYWQCNKMQNAKNNNFTKDFMEDFYCFMEDFYCLETHPSKQKRLLHLLAMKKLVQEGNSDQIKQWIEDQEKTLLNHWSFFQLMFIPYLE